MSNRQETAGLAAITAGVSVLSGGLGLAAFTGVLERAPRNHPVVFGSAFILAAVAGLLWALATLAPSAQRALKIVAMVSLTMGLLLGLGVVFVSYSEKEKPAIAAELDGHRLVGSVKMTGLRSSEQVGVRVEGLQRSDASPSGWTARILYEAAVGPNAGGAVDHSIRLAVAPGFYELLRVRATSADDYAVCPPDRVDPGEPLRRRLGTGCLVLTLSQLAPAPRVSATWVNQDKPTKALSVRATVQATNAPHRVLLRIFDGQSRTLARALLLPDGDGKVDATVEVPVTRNLRRACVVARWRTADDRQSGAPRSRPACPPPYSAGSSWVLITRSRTRG
jgi:hypothetical protein